MPVCLVARNGNGNARVALESLMVMTREGLCNGEGEPADRIHLLPIKPVGEAVAAAIVPQSPGDPVALNGVPLGPGLHLLRHTDRLSLSARDCWIAADRVAEEVDYQQDVHGLDVFCFVTKCRLGKGDRVVACPGCNLVAKADAWALLVAGHLKCPHCGFDPSQPPWEPPEPRKRIELDELYRLATGRGNGHDVGG